MARITDYVYPNGYIDRSDLARLDATGKYVAEPMVRGDWLRIQIRADGGIASATDRHGADMLPWLPRGAAIADTGLRVPMTLTGIAEGVHLRRIQSRYADKPASVVLTDALSYGDEDLRRLALRDRRSYLVLACATMTTDRFAVVSQRDCGFVALYDANVRANGLGVVIKQAKAKYTAQASGKTRAWKICRPTITAPYVVCGVGENRGGRPLLSLGLRFGPTLGAWATHLFYLPMPKHFGDARKYIGRIVDVEGCEIQADGVMTYARVVRVRDDLTTDTAERIWSMVRDDVRAMRLATARDRA
jgi:hypothetical protein